jgi:YVTN family beta-propeller protein
MVSGWCVAVEESNSVAFIDTATNKLALNLKVKGKNPEHAVFSPDGKWLYVSAEEGDVVDIIDGRARKQITSITLGQRPRGIGFLPDSSRAYVAAEEAHTVYSIDTAKQTVLKVIKAGQRANGIAVRPDGKRVYVSNGADGTVSVIDTADDSVIATIRLAAAHGIWRLRRMVRSCT